VKRRDAQRGGAWQLEQRTPWGWTNFGPTFAHQVEAEAFRARCEIPGVLELRLRQVGAEQLEIITRRAG